MQDSIVRREQATARIALSAILTFAGVSAAPSSMQSPATSQGTTTAAEGVPPHETFTIDSKMLREIRRVNFYTPPGYDEAAGARDDLVLYVPDGGLEEDFPHVAADIDAAIRAGEMRPAVVVGIENTERRRDMTGTTEVESDRKIAPHVGGSVKFRAFIRDELMPVVQQRYHARGQTAIVGESLAGLFVVETFLEEPRMFDTYIALSPSLWWNGQALVRGAARCLRGRPRLTATFYFATASDDGIDEAATALAAALRGAGAKGLTWFYDPRPDLKHSTIYRGASPGVFRKLFPPVQATR
jgi:predicted alpha/beta superfamily hydrolase